VKRRIYIWSSLLGAVLLAWLAHRAWLAHQNLVTLDVRDADVRDVLRKCEWQTWETIVVHKDVKGKVTYTCNKVPLEEVLTVISEQTSTRISAVYPIFSKGKSFVNLRKLARGDIYRDTAGWTNFTMVGNNNNNGGGRGGRGGGGFGGGGGFADTVRSQNSPVTLNVTAKDLGFATLALARFSNAQVVPEDGADGLVTLSLQQVPFAKAVAKVAKSAHKKWDVFYSVQAQPDMLADRGGDFGFGGRRGFGREGDTNSFNTNRWEELREQRDAQREREQEARLATMTPEEIAKQKEEEKKFEEIRNMPPEQQRQAFEQMRNNPQMAQRFEARGNSAFKNATPEQRVQSASRRAEMKNRRLQQQQSR
jgi:hypothetical protein